MTFSFDSTPSDGVLPGGSSSDATRYRGSGQQEDGPSNVFGLSSSASRNTPLFGQSSSNPDTPFSFQRVSPTHPPAKEKALFGASSAHARQSRGSSSQAGETSNIFSSASSSTGGATLFGRSPSQAESIFSFQNVSPSVQPPDRNPLFGATFRDSNTSRVTTPQNDRSPIIFAQPSRHSSTSWLSSPRNSSIANTSSPQTSGVLLSRTGSANADSSRDLRSHDCPFYFNIVGSQSNTSSPFSPPWLPASSSTTTSGDRILTPRTDSRSPFSTFASELDLNASPGPSSQSPSVDQPQVHQSIEQQDDGPNTPASFRNRPRSRTDRSFTSQTPSAHGRIPSVSLSPPEQCRGSGLDDISSVDRELARLRLSTSTSAFTSSTASRPSNTITNIETDMNRGAMAVPAALNNLNCERSSSGLLTPSLGSRSPLDNDNDDAVLAPSSNMRIPSPSLTPSEPPSNHISTPMSDETSVTRNTGIQNLDTHLQRLRLSASSPRDLLGIADPLQEVVTGRDSRVVSHLEARPQDSTSLSPRQSGERRRRSSSRNITKRHDVGDEAPPNDRFNNPEFQRVFGDAKRLMRELVDMLGSSTVHSQPDSVLQRLYDETQELARFQCPPSRTVGFIGASGAGKSSLINSLLDYKDLVRTSGGGVACTCAVIEYHFYAERGFAIDIEWFSEDEMMAQLQAHLKDYRHFHLNRNSLDSENSNDSSFKDFEDRAKIAIDTFRAVFDDLHVNHPLLTSRAEEDVLELFGHWVRKPDSAKVNGKQRGLIDDECSARLIELTSENAAESGPATWPWIKKIKVYSNATILSKGLILVDLPGLEDSNAARRNITERYLRKCDEIFIVCIRNRVATNEGVKNIVELAENANIPNVSIVCTKADTYNDPLEAQRDSPGFQANSIARKVKVKDQLALEGKELEEELREYEQVIQEMGYEGLTEEQSRDLNQLNGRVREIKRRLTELEFDLQQFLITIGNTSVQSELNAKYGHRFPNNTLKVFCVSNTIYWDKREASKDAAMRHLILSGILALREHGMAMVSQSQYAAAKKYMCNDISLLLRKLGLWVQSGQGSLSAERKHHVRNTLATVERKLQMDLCGHSSELQNIAQACKVEFRTKIYPLQLSRVATWSAAGRQASQNWTLLHHSEGSRSWNKEIIEEMVKDLTPFWDDLNMSIAETNEDVLNEVDVLFDSASEFLDNNLDHSSDNPITLTSTLGLHKQRLNDHIETILVEFQGNLRTLRTDALSGLRSSYIGQAMETAYKRAGYESGSGRHARQKSIINAAVRRDDLFADLLREFQTEFRKQADNTQNLIRDAICSHLDNIRDTFNIVREENAATECESDPAFRKRVEQGVKAIQDEMEKIKRSLLS
ncbi:hypothetical protein F4808DRAFT_470696 [Astrocystis sublimbata]|nr:hypothetical protein F4808DRAFT_470696 [Astrocystis sublimbata]